MTKEEIQQLEYNEVVRNLRQKEKITGIYLSEELFNNQVEFELGYYLLERYVKINLKAGEQTPTVKRSLYYEMNAIEQTIYDELPDFVEVYRGCNSIELVEDKGQSWTTDVNTAEFFAWKCEAYERDYNRVVLKAIIPKDAIYGYVSRKDEFECIIEPEKLVDVKIFKIF